MPSTQDVLSHCASLADRAFPETGSACSAREAALYLAHTGGGESLRALASATGTHPSTVMRTVRRVESQRDDPVVDDLISGLEKSAGLGDAELTSEGDDAGRQSVAALVPDVPAMPREALEREARRFLRRLSEPGSFMMVVPDAKKGGVFCKANDYRKPIAMMPVRLGAELVREGWIKVHMRGPNSVRYRITEDGRSCLKRLLAVDAVKRQPPTGFAERGNPFLAQHQLPGTRQVMDHATGRPQQIKVNLGEDPLGWLARRKGPDGKPFLTPDEVEAGERLRTDFELAQLGPSVAQDWRKFLTPGDRLAGSPPRGGPAGGGDGCARPGFRRTSGGWPRAGGCRPQSLLFPGRVGGLRAAHGLVCAFGQGGAEDRIAAAGGPLWVFASARQRVCLTRAVAAP